MTDEKIKTIAHITLLNSTIIGGLSGCVATLIEKFLPTLPDQPGINALIHDLEQIQGLIRDLQPVLDHARKEIDSE